jgi:hypothetical protein
VAFKRAYQECYGKQSEIHYPHPLRNVPKFVEWLHLEVGTAANTIEKPTAEELEESRLPEKVATSYRAIYVHGMHLRVRSAKAKKVTCDSGVASTVLRKSKGQSGDISGQIQKAEYVGWIEEILELDYRNHYCIVLVCSWILGSTTGPHPKVVRDEYGFTLGNFVRTMPLGPDSFAFPTQCIQVFYSYDKVKSTRSGGDWKVICGTDVRGRRGDLSSARSNTEILSIGRDSDFEGLRVLQ